jgi:hypothetical protein
MGKGRPKGYSPYTDISYEELGDWLGRKSMVKVSKSWLDALIGSPTPPIATHTTPPTKIHTIKEEFPKIEYKLTNLNDE